MNEEGERKGTHIQAQFALLTRNDLHFISYISREVPPPPPFCCSSRIAGSRSWWQIACVLNGTKSEHAARLKSRGQKRCTHAKAERIREPVGERQVEQGKRWDSSAKEPGGRS